MNPGELYMQRCLELAAKGLGIVAPNPMVGCVIVSNGIIIGEGWHQEYGKAHAEVNAIRSVADPKMLQNACLYVNLEPCAHYGKTPPCADLIIEKGIPEVVIGTIDPFAKVHGKGIEKLEKAGIKVTTGVLEPACRELNKRFFTFQEKQRPYIILKWAETKDGFLDGLRTVESGQKALQISSPSSMELLHTWRGEESAILVGTNTALLDNPRLTARGGTGKNPLRIALDPMNRIPPTHHLKDSSTATLFFTSQSAGNSHHLEYEVISFLSETESLQLIMQSLHRRNIQSLLVEGGSRLLQSFFSADLWDEVRVFISNVTIEKGLSAPEKPVLPFHQQQSGDDELRIYRNRS
jgi:diaminohydroxyphosphoribosylaminopyrimidine deaminase/5-amino-6-(5-phosphoribosylamino)uracil reductase